MGAVRQPGADAAAGPAAMQLTAGEGSRLREWELSKGLPQL